VTAASEQGAVGSSVCDSLQGKAGQEEEILWVFVPEYVLCWCGRCFLTEWPDKHSCISAMWLRQEEFALRVCVE